jgi:MoaA/NifB/PqqE/SkfB family radical SAM enzyme
MAEAGVLFLTFSGGEPLLHRDFFEIGKKARDLGFALRIFTNGTLVDKKTASRIADLDPIEVEISIYGASAETHDSITHVPGSFNDTVHGAKNLLREGVTVNFKALLMRSNQMEYQDIETLAAKMGARFFYNTQIVPRDNGDRRPVALNMDEDSLLALYTNTNTNKKK